jgi:hypothetical protein
MKNNPYRMKLMSSIERYLDIETDKIGSVNKSVELIPKSTIKVDDKQLQIMRLRKKLEEN